MAASRTATATASVSAGGCSFLDDGNGVGAGSLDVGSGDCGLLLKATSRRAASTSSWTVAVGYGSGAAATTSAHWAALMTPT